MYEGPRKRRGIFQPKNTDTLRACMASLAGKSFDWTYAGTGGEDEPCPSQTRWLMDRKHDTELEPEQIGWWVPEEDIDFER
jgi:hypothetical protein